MTIVPCSILVKLTNPLVVFSSWGLSVNLKNSSSRMGQSFITWWSESLQPASVRINHRGVAVEFVALCTSGLEGAVCIELKRLGFKIKMVTAGHVHFFGQLQDVPLLNSKLNSADRILIHMVSFQAHNFDDLYDGTYTAQWQQMVHQRANLVVEKVKVRNSKLSATGAVASVIKKAIYDKIKSTGTSDGTEYPLYVYLKRDVVSIMVDTTGREALNKRGYRIKTSMAPLRETIAAALILLSHWDEQTPLIDPFCGSGTIPIEAARMALGFLNNKRAFAFQRWPIFSGYHFDLHQKKGIEDRIIAVGFDKDQRILKTADENARRAGVRKNLLFYAKAFEDLSPFRERFHVLTNPPFGIRLKEGDSKFYKSLSKMAELFPNSKICLITPRQDLERIFGCRAKKKFKFQNSGIWTWCYIFE